VVAEFWWNEDMSHKSGKIAALIAHQEGKGRAAHYLGFFDCFNQGLYYEAHDVLEELWLPCRKGKNDHFYKGLIQLAGAFVHFQKDRLRPAGALLRLARANLGEYPECYEGLRLSEIQGLIDLWLGRLADCQGDWNPLGRFPAPELLAPEEIVRS
jgi:predicted metal-dependent hydrolase